MNRFFNNMLKIMNMARKPWLNKIKKSFLQNHKLTKIYFNKQQKTMFLNQN